MANELILVAGATGKLGSVVVRRLLANGYRVRALSRNAGKLQLLAGAGAEAFIGDMQDRSAMERACTGVSQIVSTANNIEGKGATSPRRIDEPMYRTFGAAAKAAGVSRWVHISARDITPDSPVDFFRIKLLVDEVVKNSGLPWVIVKPSAFMEIWTGVLMGNPANPDKPGPVATLFGRGNRITNYIAIDDVVSFVLAILADSRLVSEVIDIGGPSEVTQVEFVAPIQRALGVPAKKRHVPAPVLGTVRVLAGPFNEVVARFASLGWWTTLSDRPFPQWPEAAARFGVTPMTLDQFARRFAKENRPDSP